ncbi:MAG: hypothetical protein IBX41_08380 [Methanophagales archaeon]|nr:hypothetical protein [Methanophagales archaeon]
MIRKNISLYDEDVKRIERLVEKHEGNLSAAIREIIEFTHSMQRKFGSLEEAKKVEKRIKGICIPNMMLNWFLTYTTECLPDESAIGSLEEIHALESVSDLAVIADIGFAVDIRVDADDDRNPTEATIQVSGERMQAEFVAKLAACFLAEHKGLVVENVSRRAASITVKLKSRGERESEANYKMMRERLIMHFGERHVMMQEILQRPKFWNSMINATTDWGDVQRHKYPRIYR